MRRDECGTSSEDSNSLTLEKGCRVLGEVFSDVVDAIVQGLDIDLGSHLFETHAAQLSTEGHRPTSCDHRLRGNAIEEVGRTADDFAFDDGDLGSETGGVRRRHVAGWTSANDEKADCHAERISVDTRSLPARDESSSS